MSLDQVIGKPSTMTAPESEQKERKNKDATIWNIVDKESIKIGQAVIIYRSNKL